MKTISNTVRKLRKNIKLTQEELADKVGVSRQTIIAMEKGDYTPSVYLALKLARFFRLKVEKIFRLSKS